MSKASTKIKNDCIKILQSADANIVHSEYTEYYFVLRTIYDVSQGSVHKFTMTIEPARFGMSRYTITKANNEQFSCYARPDAIFFHRPVADDVLEIFRALKLRYLIQKSQSK